MLPLISLGHQLLTFKLQHGCALYSFACRGWALVEFAKPAEARTALRFTGSDFLRRKVTVEMYNRDAHVPTPGPTVEAHKPQSLSIDESILRCLPSSGARSEQQLEAEAQATRDKPSWFYLWHYF